MLDYSSDFIHVPKSIIDNFINKTSAQVDPVTNNLLYPCASKNVQVILRFGTDRLILTSIDLLRPFSGDQCVLTFKANKDDSEEWRLGLAFLKKFCTVLDYNGAIGFARLRHY